MGPNKDNKELVKAPPSFSSAPNLNSSIPIPSFSSAPDLVVDKESKRESSHRRHRSRSPTHHRRRRSISPSRRHATRCYSPSHRKRSRSPISRRSREEEKSSRSKRSPEIVHTGTLKTGITFVMDRRGDPGNARYGGTHTYDMPSYRRSNGGKILGLPPHQRISPTTSKHGPILIVDQPTKKPRRYTDKDHVWKEMDKTMKRIRIRAKKQDIDPFKEHSPFIAFDDTTWKWQPREDYVASGVDYRSLEGNKVKRVEEEEEEEEEEGESFNDHIRQRTIDYNRRLDKEPENVALWLEFVRFQDEAASGLDPTASRENKASVNEVKLSIFEKALENNPTSEALVEAYLACGQETWDTLKLLREWDTMLKEHPDSIKLWSEYINIRQTNFASFSFSQCVKVFEDALLTLRRHANRNKDNYDICESLECLMVYILLRACLFMKQSGYQERAYAVMQAVVEFNLFRPRFDSAGYEDKVDAFVDFWDSEVYRFGEKDAKGWSEYHRMTQQGEEVPEPVIETKPRQEEEEEEAETMAEWYDMEVKNEEKNRLSLRMSQAEDDALDEDPYRVTLSDDVKPFLVDITTTGARQNLIYSILVFLGLPYTPPEVGTNTHFFEDTFTHHNISFASFWPPKETSNKVLVWYVAGVPMNPEQTVEELCPYHIPNAYPVGVHEMFAKRDSWFRAPGKEYVPNGIDQAFTKNAFEQLLTVERSEHLTLCYFAFVSSCNYKTGRKLAKALLKDQPENLTLWNAFAQMEKGCGRVEEACKVYCTVLSTYRQYPEKEQLVAPLLYYMFAQLEVEQDRPMEGLKILVSMADATPYDQKTPQPTTLTILKARKYFNQRLLQVSTLSESYSERSLARWLVSCSALFEYLSSGLDSACLVYERALEYIKSRQAERGYESEMIWIEYAGFLYNHDTNRSDGLGHKPGLLRQLMERAIDLFPNNTMFLSFYIWNETKTKIMNRVQTLFNKTLKKSNVALWLSAIYSELHRYKPYQIHSVRSYFERAVSDKRTSSSIILWKHYIQFEINLDNDERARTVFYRSIRECPWSKELYMLGIKSFEKTMDAKEMKELVHLIIEKEIRLRRPIDETLLA